VRLTSMRLALFGLAVALATQAGAQTVTAKSTRELARVVFVCEHGSVKSLVAMEYFNRKARERGLAYQAVARGTAPERAVPDAVRVGLRTDGFETSDFVPLRLTASDVEHAALVVSFDQDITAVVAGKARHIAWDGLPGVLADYPGGRTAIVTRIDALLDELARANPP